VFILAGVGAGIAGLSSGHQTTPGTAYNGPILLGLGVAYVLVGVGLWVEQIWAWWAGLVLASTVVVVDLIRGIHDGGFVEWSVFLVLFVVSIVQGRPNRATLR
jgi:uncharacterized membrane protein (DUF2068 family)